MTYVLNDKKALIFGLLTVTFIALSIVGGFRAYSPVPYADMWNGYLDFYVKASSGDISVWWTQHNEHRIFLARLLFWVDLALFSGQGWSLIIINYLLIGMVCLIFWKIWRERTAGNIPMMGLFLIAWLFYWAQEENFTWGFQSQFILAQLLPLAAFYFLHRAAPSGPQHCREFYIAVLFGLLANGSMANGVLTLPLMTAYAVLARLSWKKGFLLGILSIGMLSLYFLDYKSPEIHGSLTQALLESPLTLVLYVLLYLGSPFYFFFGGFIGAAVATIAGFFLVVSSVAFAWRIVPVSHKATLSLALLVFVIYICGTALGTGSSRAIFGVNQALSSRYVTPALMAWAALLLLFLPNLEAMSKSARNKICILLFLIMLLMLPVQLKTMASKQRILFEREIAVLALELGIKDRIQIRNVFPYTDWAQSIAEKPIASNLSIFGVPPFRDAREIIGQKIPLDFRSDYECKGVIDEVQSVEVDGLYLQVKGWVFDSRKLSVPRSALLIDETGIVQGIIIAGQERKDIAKTINPAAKYSGFKGYVKTNAQGKSVALFFIEGNCWLSTIIPEAAEMSLTSFSQVVPHNVPHNTWTDTDYHLPEVLYSIRS